MQPPASVNSFLDIEKSFSHLSLLFLYDTTLFIPCCIIIPAHLEHGSNGSMYNVHPSTDLFAKAIAFTSA